MNESSASNLSVGSDGNPFAQAGPWLRGNIHTHTTASDGQMSVAGVADWYARHQYDFLCITDHDVVAPDSLGSRSTPSGIVVIPGAEIGVKLDGSVGAEVCALGIQEVRQKYVHPQRVIDDTIAQGGVAIMSHPHMSGVYSGLLMPLEGLAGIEVFNAACFGSGRRGFSLTHWDDLLTAGRRVWGTASDDRHSADESDPRGAAIQHDKAKGWIMLKSPGGKSADAILSAIRSGWFYSSTGPEIHDIQVKNGKIHVRCSPVRSIRLVTLPWCGTCVDAGKGQTIIETTIDVGMAGTPNRMAQIAKAFGEKGFFSPGLELPSFFRIECWDGDHGYAWSNPLFLSTGT